MKIRTGFVSNSSSSSFCLYGWYVKKDKISTENVIKLYLDLAKTNKHLTKSEEDLAIVFENEPYMYFLYDIIYRDAEIGDCQNSIDGIYIGKVIKSDTDPDKIKEDAYKIKDKYDKFIEFEGDPEFYEEAWTDY